MLVDLLDGRSIESSNLRLNEDNYSVSIVSTGEDVTNNLRQNDKAQIFAGFDRAKDNLRSYVEQYRREHNGATPAPTGDTSLWGNFWTQITTEPLRAPLDALNTATDSIFENNTVRVLTGVALIIAALYAASLLARLEGK